MRLTSIGQEDRTGTRGVFKAGAAGALAGGILCKLAPLTTEEHAHYFNVSAQNAIRNKVQKVRSNEVNKIKEEIGNGILKVSKDVGDVFIKRADDISSNNDVDDIVKQAPDKIKEGLKGLISRVNTVSAAKEHIETNNIKNAAKAARPLSYFIVVGAIVAMSGKLIKNALQKDTVKEKPQEPQVEKPSIADLLLEGFGSNTDILLLTNENAKNNQ